MTSKYWIKLYHEILNDPKMGRLSEHLWKRCIEFFLIAGEHDDNGALPPIEDMAWTLRADNTELEQDLLDLSGVGIVEQDGDRWIVINFAKRQAPVNGAERQRRYRARQHKEQYYGDEPITKRNAESDDTNTRCQVDTDTDTDTDTEKIQSKNKQRGKRTRASPGGNSKTPEAVKVFRTQAHRYPAKSWYGDVSRIVGKDPPDLEFWGSVVKSWVGRGYNPTNVEGMLECYQKRQLPGQAQQAQSPTVKGL